MMKINRILGWSTLLACLLSACTSTSDNEPSGEGTLTLSLLPSTSFTRAVDESPFTNVKNYTVELYRDDELQWSQSYDQMELKTTIESGTYRIVAHYGHNPVADFDSLYVEGSLDFIVRSGETKEVNLTCVPANAKIVVKTSDDFDTYFSDYRITFDTDGLAAPLVYGKQEVETERKDVYVRTDKSSGKDVTLTFALTPRSDDVTFSRELESFTRNVKPQDCLTFTLKPDVTTVASGTVNGITITIDDSVTVEDINITLSSDWLN